MFKLPILFILFVCAGAVLGQNANVVANKPTRAANGNYYAKEELSTIRGMIVYADTNKPLRRASFKLLHPDTLTSADRDFLTDDEGRFVIRARAGTYYFNVDTPGILNPDSFRGLARRGDGLKASREKLDRLFESVTVDGVSEAQVIVRVRRAGVITGTVAFSDGSPAPGVTVVALRQTAGSFERSDKERVGNVETDDRGVYRFFGLPDGIYLVCVFESTTQADYDFRRERLESEVRTYYPSATTFREAKTVELVSGLEQTEINITIPDRRYFAISGIVTRSVDGKPVSGAIIRCSRADDEILNTSGLSFPSRADDDGRFQIQDLPPGKYELTIDPPYSYEPPSEDGRLPEKKQPKLATSRRTIEIKDANVEEINVKLVPGAVISGTVRFEGTKPPDEVSIAVYDADGNGTGRMARVTFTEKSPQKASFEVEGVAGKRLEFYAWLDGPYFLKSVRAGSRDALSEPLEIKEGETVDGVEILISDKVGTVKGRIRRSDPNAEYRTVALLPVATTKFASARATRWDEPDDRGEFEIYAAPGEYFLVQLEPANIFDDKEESWEDWYKRLTANAEKITVKEGETKTVELRLPPD